MEKSRFAETGAPIALTVAAISTVTTTYSQWIDTMGFQSLLLAIKAVLTTGQITAIVFNEADASDQSDAAAMDDHFADYQPGILPLAGPSVTAQILVGCRSKKRYVQIGFTSAFVGGVANIAITGEAILQNAEAQPPIVNSSVLTLAQINAPAAEGDANVTFPKR